MINTDWKTQSEVNKAFNKKWSSHLSEGHYGMDIGDYKVAEYLNKEFESLREIFPNFQYQQIKLKFGQARIYMSIDGLSHTELSKLTFKLEKNVDDILAEVDSAKE